MFSIIKSITGFMEGFLIGTGLLIVGIFTLVVLKVINPITPFVILSGSMEPVIPTGSVVLVQPRSVYTPGTVITYSKNGKEFTTHRIVSAVESGFITKGDANKGDDPGVVNREHIKGSVVLTLPGLGYLVGSTKKPQGFILLVIVPATIIIYEELKTIGSEIKKMLLKIKIPSGSNLGYARVAVLVPVISTVFILVGLSNAFFHDTEVSKGNVLSAGSWVAPNDPSPTPGVANQLVINELVPTSTCNQGNVEAQYLELYNGYSHTVQLKNFKLTDGVTTIDVVTSASAEVGPGELVILAHSSSLFGKDNKCYEDPGVEVINLGGTLDLNTGILKLLTAENIIIDRVEWAKGISPVVDQSFERQQMGFDSAWNDEFAASDFTVKSPPTPGL